MHRHSVVTHRRTPCPTAAPRVVAACRMPSWHTPPTRTPGVPSPFARHGPSSPCSSAIAYLNAGTFGPLARSHRRGDAPASSTATSRTAAAGCRTSSTRWRSARSASGRRSARSSAPTPEQLALTSSTTEGCNIVAAGSGSRRGTRSITTTASTRGCCCRCTPRARRVIVGRADRRGDPRRGHPADAAARALPGAVDDRCGRPGARAASRHRRPRARRRRAVRRRDPGRRARASTSSPSRGRSGCAAPTPPERSSSPSRKRCGSRRRATSRRSRTAPDGSFVARDGAARFEAAWWSGGALRRAAGRARDAPRLVVRPRVGRGGALSGTPRRAVRGRHADGSARRSCRFRPDGDSAAVVASLARARRARARDPRHRSRAGLVRLVDERRRRRSPARGPGMTCEGGCACGAVRYVVDGAAARRARLPLRRLRRRGRPTLGGDGGTPARPRAARGRGAALAPLRELRARREPRSRATGAAPWSSGTRPGGTRCRSASRRSTTPRRSWSAATSGSPRIPGGSRGRRRSSSRSRSYPRGAPGGVRAPALRWVE